MDIQQTINFSIVTAPTIERLIDADLAGCISVVRNAYLLHARGNAVNPTSAFLRFPRRPNARIIALPAHLDEPSAVSGIKWIASYPDNVHGGIPRASAVIVLNRDDDGYPFACLEGALISSARTAASAVLAAEHLMPTPKRARCLAVVGAGVIARRVYQFLVGTGWSIDRLIAHDLNRDEAERFAAFARRLSPGTVVEISKDVRMAISEADLVLFTTSALTPYLADHALFAHRPVMLHLSLRDLAPEIILNSDNIVDDIDHALQANTSVHLASQETGSREFISGSIADVIEGRWVVSHSRPVVFSPFGLGILDLALGLWLYDQAVALGEHIPIPNFFGRLER